MKKITVETMNGTKYNIDNIDDIKLKYIEINDSNAVKCLVMFRDKNEEYITSKEYQRLDKLIKAKKGIRDDWYKMNKEIIHRIKKSI